MNKNTPNSPKQEQEQEKKSQFLQLDSFASTRTTTHEKKEEHVPDSSTAASSTRGRRRRLSSHHRPSATAAPCAGLMPPSRPDLAEGRRGPRLPSCHRLPLPLPPPFLPPLPPSAASRIWQRAPAPPPLHLEPPPPPLLGHGRRVREMWRRRRR